MHGHVDVRRPGLGLQRIVGINSVGFQAATLLQVSLKLRPAPPENGEKKQGNNRNVYLDKETCVRRPHHRMTVITGV